MIEFEQYSRTRLRELENAMKEIDSLKSELKTLAVYVCGSYGRLEAHENSDIDPFFVNVWEPGIDPGDGEDGKLSKLEITKFFADFIRVLENLKFMKPSRDGEYLQVHELQKIREYLGSPKDDAENLFTARMLLLLESRPICNKETYERLACRVIDYYFQDYHDHVKDFRPIFLLNDIHRYWKTMCLNYEHLRKLKSIDGQKMDRAEKEALKAKVHLKNLKLKFSRLMICFSMIIPLARQAAATPDSIRSLVDKTPMDRLGELPDIDGSSGLTTKVLTEYASFLSEVSSDDIVNHMSNEDYRREQFVHAQQFADSMYDLLKAHSHKKILRYITI